MWVYYTTLPSSVHEASTEATALFCMLGACALWFVFTKLCARSGKSLESR